MHQAYKVHNILKQGVHIESISACGDNVILGTRSGQLIMYCVDQNGTVDMLMFNKNFSKKPITQMEVIATENLLFVLTDSIIHVCDIRPIESNFAFIHNSPETKGCSLFTVNVQMAKSTTGESATVIRVCCAVKRRLQFFYWKLNALQCPKFIIELKDVPKALCWIGDVVCVGFKDEYVIYNIHANKPVKHDLIVTSSSYNMDPCICMIKDNLLGVSKDEYLVTIDPSDYIKTNDEKIHSNLENLPSSTQTKQIFKPMQWSSPLLGLVWDDPFAVGRTANGIEIRCLEGNSINKDTLIQSIPELAKAKFLVRSGKGIMFAAALSELWYIRLVDIPTQRQNLLQQKKFQLAIELTSISDEPEEAKAETIRQIQMRFAKELFANKQFSAAMTEFSKAVADPYDVIRLFPNLLQDQTNKVPPNLLAGEGSEAPSTAVSLNATPSVLEDKDLENALNALIEFLTLARQKEIVKLRDTKGSTKSFLLSIIDTTLLKCYLQMNDTLVAPLLRLNQCHLEESEKTLKKHDKISELIILYETNGKHRKALELLRDQATIEGSSLFGIERTIRYLQSLGSSNIQLIFEFSDWVLNEYSVEGLRIFTEDFIEVENLPRASVLDFLLSKHKQCVIPYLEHVIYVWDDSNTFLHNVLVKQYLEKIESIVTELKLDDSEEKREKKRELDKYRSKLLNYLQNSQNYSPDVILQDFPTNSLLAERALILGRLRKHEKVLAIYIQILGDFQKATEYCEENYAEKSDIFLMLLKTILNPLKEPPYPGIEFHPEFIKPNHDVALQLLNKYATKTNAAKVWPNLPNDMPLYKLRTYMETVLRTHMDRKHHSHVMQALLIAEGKRLHEQIEEFKQKPVTITEFRVCPECKKRFINQSAFVRYPNSEVVHLSCYDKRKHVQ